MPRNGGWDDTAARDVLRRNAPAQAALPLGQPAVRNREVVHPETTENQRGRATSGLAESSAAASSPRLQPDADGWYELIVPGEPQVWERAGVKVITPKGKACPACGKSDRKPIAMHYTPDATRTFEETIAAMWTSARGPLIGPLVELEVLVFQTPFKNGNRRRGDWDNFGKAASDALNRVAYEDDWRIVDARVRKFVDEYNPRLVIRLRQAADQ